MVVLSVAIISSGKTLVARQFVEMTRLRVEGLLSAFPKLIDSGKDHTFIETETVRYVYQPMEALYLVLVTNRSSNILEDLETLRLLAKVVQDCCKIQVNEELVLKHVFDIVFAFDEVISFGHRESVTLSQIKTYTEMDSHEEKLHQMIEISKINEAKEMAKKKQQELAKLRASQPKDSTTSISGGGPPAPPTSGSFQQSMTVSPAQDTVNTGIADWTKALGDDNANMLKPAAPSAKNSMKLKKKSPTDVLASLGVTEPEEATGAAASGEKRAEQEPPAVNPLLDPVRVEITENITANLQVEGGLAGEAECQGAFQVTVLDTTKADLVAFKLCEKDKSFTYKVHPNLNKQSHAENTLEVREARLAYKANAPAPVVKWRLGSTSEKFLPVSLSCWPSATSDGTQIIVELELTDDSVTLEDVTVTFTTPGHAKVEVQNAEPGEAAVRPGEALVWVIPQLGKGAQGNLEFTATCDSATLLPFVFRGVWPGHTKCPMDILECYHQERKEPITYACEKSSVFELKVGAS